MSGNSPSVAAHGLVKTEEQSIISKIRSSLPMNMDPPSAARETSIYDPPEGETGWDRVKAMFVKDELGYRSGEMNFVLQGTFAAFFTGACIGSSLASRQALDTYVRRNQDTLYKTQYDAKRRLNDHVFLSSAKGAMRIGGRLAFLSGTYLLTVMTVSVYRNKSSLWEYIAGGVTSGSLYRFNLGLKGIFAGGIIGGFLGTTAGCVSLAAMWATGTSMEEIRYWKNQNIKKRQSEVYQKMAVEHQKHLNPLELARGGYLMNEDDDQEPQVNDGGGDPDVKKR